MADEEKKRNAFVLALTQHGEKIGLGVSGLLLLVYLVTGVLLRSADQNTEALAAAAKKIHEESGREHEDLKPQPAEPYVADAVQPWMKETLAASIPDAFAYDRTKLTFTFKEDVVRVNPVRMPTILPGAAEAELDGVLLSWSLDPVDPKNYRPAELKKTRIERAVKDAKGNWGSWEKTAEVGGNTLQYKDQKIKPKTMYRYRLIGWTDNREIGRPESEPTTPLTAETHGIWRFSWANPQVDPQGRGMVLVTIKKFDQKYDDTFEFRYLVYAGDELGKKDGTTTHRLHSKRLGRTVEVDFASGARLETVEEIRRPLLYQKCNLTSDGFGVRTCTLIEARRPYSGHAIIYLDEDGKVVDQWDPDPDPLIQDVYLPDCPEHGHKAPQPKEEDPEVKKKRERESAARKALDTVEQLLSQSRNNEEKKKQAIEKLKAFLKDFADTDFAKNNAAKIAKLKKDFNIP